MSEIKDELVGALGRLNDEVLAKLDDLSEYDRRRPLTPTGTNLLGIVKHLASVQAGYFGDVFGRPWPDPQPWHDPDATLNADMYATANESSEWVIDFYRRSWAHANETFAGVPIDGTGAVPWWPAERQHPTLQTVLLHMTVETARHAGHIDVVRELIDSQAGRFNGDPSVPSSDEIDWTAYVAQVQANADEHR